MKSISLLLASGITLFSGHAYANEKQLEDFVEARLLEINQENASALKGYNVLFERQSDSEILADRLFETSLRQGDMRTALKAVDSIEKLGPLPVQAHILRYSAALKDKKWTVARAALSSIKSDPVFGFMEPIMQSWIETAKGSDGAEFLKTANNSGLTNFYATDQVIYQLLYQNKLDKVRRNIVSIRPFSEAYARDLILKAAPILHNGGKTDFTAALLNAQGSGAAEATLKLLNSGDGLPRYMAQLTPEIAVARLYSRVSNTLVEQELFEIALFFARTAHWLAPDDRAISLNLGSSLAVNDQAKQASLLLTDIKSSDPYYSIYSGQNVRILLDDNHNQDAVKIAFEAHKFAPNSDAILLLLAQTYDSVKQYDEAADSYEKLIKSTADDQLLRKSYLSLYWARSLSNGGRWKKAKKALDKGLIYNDKNPYLLNYYGYTLLNSGEDIDRGFDLIRQAYAIEPNSADITDSLGWGYFLRGNITKAIPLLEQAVRSSDQDIEIKEHLGDAYWTVGRLVDARYIWRIASLIAEDDVKARLDHKAEYGLDIPYVKS